MKTIVLILLFVQILVPSQNVLANTCHDNWGAQTLTSLQQYCVLVRPGRQRQSFGTTLKTLLESNKKPMKCQLVAEQQVYECHGLVGDYPRPTRIYFKANMVQPSGLNIHFHGHFSSQEGRNAVNFPFRIPDGDYARMLSNSKADKILVIPESIGRVETYLAHFQPVIKWLQWQEDLHETLGIEKPLPLVLSGHSGSDALLDFLGSDCQNQGWDCGQIRALGLFDANFGDIINQKLVGRDGLVYLARSVIANDGILYLRDTVGLSPAFNNIGLIQAIGPGKINKALVPLNGMSPTAKHMAIMKDGGFSQFLEIQ